MNLMPFVDPDRDNCEESPDVLRADWLDESATLGRWGATLSVDHCENPAACLAYQRYFLRGLDAETDGRIALEGRSTRLLHRLVRHQVPGSRKAFNALARVRLGRNASPAGNHVGRYTFSFAPAASDVKVAIDAEDDGVTYDRETLAWSDIYFKTNKWSHAVYDPKVRPCLNGNSMLDAQAIDSLRALRHAANPTTDLIYWAKIWAPRTHAAPKTNRAIVEHQLRVFEALATLPCRSSLLAILPPALRFVDLDDCRRRLDRAGIPWQVGWGEIDTETFWRSLAQATIVFGRAGNHHCVSWRMTDLLCMGACVMLEGAPYPQWYAPLVRGRHYADAGCRMSPDFTLPDKSRYASITGNVLALLENHQTMSRMREAGIDYFERYAEPSAVARYLLTQIRAIAAARSHRSAMEIFAP